MKTRSWASDVPSFAMFVLAGVNGAAGVLYGPTWMFWACSFALVFLAVLWIYGPGVKYLRRFWFWLNTAQRKREQFHRDVDRLEQRLAKLDRDIKRYQANRLDGLDL